MKVYNPTTTMNENLRTVLAHYREKRNFNAEEWVNQKVELINDYFTECNLKAAVLGVSGGIDSSVVLALLVKARATTGSNLVKIVPLLLPALNYDGATNQNNSITQAEDLCASFDVKPRKFTHLVELANIVSQGLDEILDEKSTPWSQGQLVAHVRTPVIYNTTSILTDAGFPAIVAGTTNLSEGGYLGYVGKASDGLVDLQIISDLYKSEVYAVARYLGIPDSIMNAIPTGDMYDGREDEEVFGASYDFVELYHLWLQNGSDSALLNDDQFVAAQHNLENLHSYNAHKYTYGSPAIHIDILDARIPNGWNNPIWRKKN
jgi:NAD+ synthetase